MYSVIAKKGRLWTFRNWFDIILSPASHETAKTNKPPRHYTKTGGQNIIYSLKKKKKHTQWSVTDPSDADLSQPDGKGGNSRRRMGK